MVHALRDVKSGLAGFWEILSRSLSEPRITLIAQMGYDAPRPFVPFWSSLPVKARGGFWRSPTEWKRMTVANPRPVPRHRMSVMVGCAEFMGRLLCERVVLRVGCRSLALLS